MEGVTTLTDLATVGGLATATTLVVALLKPVLGVSGRGTHALALCVAFLLAVASKFFGGTQSDWIEIIFKSVLAAASSVGLHQTTVGIKKE